MRTGSFVSRVGAVIRALRLTPRRVWWTSFVLVTLLSGLWGLSNPVFAGPDEPSHVIRAVGLDHGQPTGKEPRARPAKEFRSVEQSARVVRAPAIFGSVGAIPCFAHHRDLLPPCLRFEGSAADDDIVTYTARQPPAYYAAVGIASWVRGSGSATVYLMRLLGALITGAFVATAITGLRRFSSPRLVAAGLVVAVTPMVLFMSSVVNPNGPEVAAAIALWVCGLALVSQARERVDSRLVTAAGIAACVLALSRQLGPLWLALIVVMILGVTSRPALRNLARSGPARLWAALITVSALAQVAWDVIVRPRDATLVARSRSGLSALEAAQDAFGSTFEWYRQMIGWFGWLDTPAPVLTWVPWTAALAFFFFVALAWATWRYAAVLLALLVAVIVVPVVIEATPYRAGGTFWQGRYILPLAVGIPILAAFALASTERGRELVTGRFALTIGVVVGVAQLLAFAQNLRRYTVGYDGEIQYWKHPEWLPPVLSPLLLTLAFAAVVVAFTAWLLWPARTARRSGVESSVSASRV